MKYPFAALLAFLLLAGPSTADPVPEGPKNLETINTKADEDDPFLSGNGLTLYYSSNGKGKSDILLSQRRAAGQAEPLAAVFVR